MQKERSVCGFSTSKQLASSSFGCLQRLLAQSVMPHKINLRHFEDALQLSARLLHAIESSTRNITSEAQRSVTPVSQSLTRRQQYYGISEALDVLGAPTQERSQSVRVAMHRTPPQKLDKTSRPPTPVLLPDREEVVLRPITVNPDDDPHQPRQRRDSVRKFTPEYTVDSNPSMIRDERGVTHNPVIWGRNNIPYTLQLHLTEPTHTYEGIPITPIDWTEARRENSLPLRGYPSNTPPQPPGIKPLISQNLHLFFLIFSTYLY